MNYQNGKIYRIDCNITGEIYIGSTCQPTVAKRLAKHVNTFKTWKKTGKGFITSYPIIERDKYSITMIEAYPCNSKDELTSREGFYIRSMNCVNKQIAGRTQKDYYESNKEHLLEQMKIYNEANKERVKELRDTNKEKISARRKELREANKEQINEKQKIKRDANKDESNARQNKYREKKRLDKLQKNADP